jgi:acyl-CoA synthetase (AMP-forming)/AMP-acid ligase II
MTTIRDLLNNGIGTQTALVVAGGGPSVTYDQLRANVDELVATLNQFGIGRGDRVAMALPNGIEMIVCFIAAAIAGTAAPLNPAYRIEEFRFYLEDTSARALIVPVSGAEEARQAAGPDTLLIKVVVDESGHVALHAISEVSPAKSTAPPSEKDTALVLHTSGTTSRPKRVPLSHANIIASVKNIARTYDLTSNDVSFCVMPLFHVHGLIASTLSTLYTGGKVVTVPRFSPLSFWSSVRDHGVTWYSAVPTIHQLLLARTRSGARPSGAEQLRFVRSCSASLSPQMMAEMEEKFGVQVLDAYGMTEATHQMASNPLEPSVRKAGSVGLATGIDIAILDPKGVLQPSGKRGEVSIMGANVTAGYENNEEANASSFTNGWFRTGDEGYFDEDGYLVLTGRIKELINRGGEKIAPREIDEALLAHPAVAEAVTFGLPDRVYGESVAAAVVLQGEATEGELILHCKSLIADFKVPAKIFLVDAIPRTATGKIQRRNVATMLAAERDK